MLLLFRSRFISLVSRYHNKIKWWHLLLFLIFHLSTSWLFTASFEPDAEYVQADTYWYFYFVCVTTLGFGDFSPTEIGSRAVLIFYVMPAGMVMIGAIIGKIAAVAVEMIDKTRRGLMQLNLENHTVVVGDGTKHTIALLRNLIADTSVGDVVLVSSELEFNPLSEDLTGFVSGDVDDDIVRKRACFATAKRIIVLGESDTMVTGRTISVMDCASATAEIIAYFQHDNGARQMNSQTDARVRTVSSVSMDLVVQEALDPGAAAFIKELLRNAEGGTYVRCVVPDGVRTTWSQLGAMLMDLDFNPLCLYVNGKPVAMPKGKSPIGAGDCVGVAAENREQLDLIDWSLVS
jgi:voltage-gated potassium channel